MQKKKFFYSEDFIEERDYRREFIRDKGLIKYLCSKVLIKGRPISTKTVKRTFETDCFDNLTDSRLAVWMESYNIIEDFKDNEESFAE